MFNFPGTGFELFSFLAEKMADRQNPDLLAKKSLRYRLYNCLNYFLTEFRVILKTFSDLAAKHPQNRRLSNTTRASARCRGASRAAWARRS